MFERIDSQGAVSAFFYALKILGQTSLLTLKGLAWNWKFNFLWFNSKFGWVTMRFSTALNLPQFKASDSLNSIQLRRSLTKKLASWNEFNSSIFCNQKLNWNSVFYCLFLKMEVVHFSSLFAFPKLNGNSRKFHFIDFGENKRDTKASRPPSPLPAKLGKLRKYSGINLFWPSTRLDFVGWFDGRTWLRPLLM